MLLVAKAYSGTSIGALIYCSCSGHALVTKYTLLLSGACVGVHVGVVVAAESAMTGDGDCDAIVVMLSTVITL